MGNFLAYSRSDLKVYEPPPGRRSWGSFSEQKVTPQERKEAQVVRFEECLQELEQALKTLSRMDGVDPVEIEGATVATQQCRVAGLRAVGKGAK